MSGPEQALPVAATILTSDAEGAEVYLQALVDGYDFPTGVFRTPLTPLSAASEAIAAAREQGALEERERIVAWLREDSAKCADLAARYRANDGPADRIQANQSHSEVLAWAANQIESGAALGSEG